MTATASVLERSRFTVCRTHVDFPTPLAPHITVREFRHSSLEDSWRMLLTEEAQEEGTSRSSTDSLLETAELSPITAEDTPNIESPPEGSLSNHHFLSAFLQFISPDSIFFDS